MLGMTPVSDDIWADYIRSKGTAADVSPELLDEEAETLPEAGDDVDPKGLTGFNSDETGAFLFDYQLKGAVKDAFGMLRRVVGSQASKVKAYLKEIDGLVFVTDRRVYLQFPEGTDPDNLRINVRPLRAKTAQGERVSIARSYEAPVGTRAEFTFMILGGAIKEAHIRELLWYWGWRGWGCWRNASWGRVKIVAFEPVPGPSMAEMIEAAIP